MIEFLQFALRFYKKKFGLALAIPAFIVLVANQTKDEERTWGVYKADAESTSYAPLSQINERR